MNREQPRHSTTIATSTTGHLAVIERNLARQLAGLPLPTMFSPEFMSLRTAIAIAVSDIERNRHNVPRCAAALPLAALRGLLDSMQRSMVAERERAIAIDSGKPLQ